MSFVIQVVGSSSSRVYIEAARAFRAEKDQWFELRALSDRLTHREVEGCKSKLQVSAGEIATERVELDSSLFALLSRTV